MIVAQIAQAFGIAFLMMAVMVILKVVMMVMMTVMVIITIIIIITAAADDDGDNKRSVYLVEKPRNGVVISYVSFFVLIVTRTYIASYQPPPSLCLHVQPHLLSFL